MSFQISFLLLIGESINQSSSGNIFLDLDPRGKKKKEMAKLYVKAVAPPDMNRNTEWFMYPGVWTTYILIIFFGWLAVLSVSGCSPGMAWTVVNLSHFLVSCLLL